MTSSTLSSQSGNSVIVAISSNPVVRDRMIRAIESCDCSTVEAQGGAEILAQLDGAGFDFAVLDSKLPDLDSAEVTRFIRQQNPNISYVMVDSTTGKLAGTHQDKPSPRMCRDHRFSATDLMMFLRRLPALHRLRRQATAFRRQ